MGVLSRRRPWPFDAIIHAPHGDVGVMLTATADGEMVGRKVQPFERVQPTDYTYQSFPPYVERVYPFKRLAMGMGERVQTTPLGESYWYARYVDCSIGGTAIKAAAFHPLTPTLTGSIHGFVEALDNGTLRLFALAGRYMLRRAGDTGATWTQVGTLDLGAGHYFTSAARFYDGSASPKDALYVTTDTGLLYRLKADGTGWDEMSAFWTGASAGQKATYVAVIGNELWRGWANFVSKTEGDPADGAVWTGRMSVGDASQPITWLAGNIGNIYIFKRNGIYTLNTDGSDNELFPSLRALPADLNGQQATAWNDALWAPWGSSLHQVALSGDAAQLIPSGFERLLENDSPVQGIPTCVVGHNSWFLYVVLFNAANDTSYLCKLGTWKDPESTSTEYTFQLNPHGALYEWTGKRATAMTISTVPGANPRLYIGFDNGSVEYAILPKDTPSSINDAACEFTQTVGEIHWPIHTGLAESDTKTWRSFSAFGPKLNVNNYVTFQYRIEPGASALTDMGSTVTSTGMRLDFPENTYSRQIEVVERLHNTSQAETPIVEGAAIYEAIRPAMQLQYDFVVQAGSYSARRDGTVDARSAEHIRQRVRESIGHPGSVDIELPDETIRNLSALTYVEAMAPKSKRFGPEWNLSVSFVEWRTEEVYGTFYRLKPYPFAELTSYTFEDLGGL